MNLYKEEAWATSLKKEGVMPALQILWWCYCFRRQGNYWESSLTCVSIKIYQKEMKAILSFIGKWTYVLRAQAAKSPRFVKVDAEWV